MSLPKDLLQKCIARDETAWNEFIRHYTPLVSKTVCYKLKKLSFSGTKKEIPDVVQEIFLNIWEKNKLSGIKNISSLEGWLVILTLNSALNYYLSNISKQTKNTISLNNDSISDPYSPLSLVLPDKKLDTTAILEKNELNELLSREISTFTQQEQLALKLFIYEGVKQKDIAKIMRMPQGTVGTLINRAKNKLRGKLHKMSYV